MNDLLKLASKATDLPWKTNIKAEILSNSGRPIINTIYDDEDTLPRTSDAEFIVSACNNAESMVKQIEWMSMMLSVMCKSASAKGNCNLFYSCPAWKYGWTCGKVSHKEWQEAAEDKANA